MAAGSVFTWWYKYEHSQGTTWFRVLRVVSWYAKCDLAHDHIWVNEKGEHCRESPQVPQHNRHVMWKIGIKNTYEGCIGLFSTGGPVVRFIDFVSTLFLSTGRKSLSIHKANRNFICILSSHCLRNPNSMIFKVSYITIKSL